MNTLLLVWVLFIKHLECNPFSEVPGIKNIIRIYPKNQQQINETKLILNNFQVKFHNCSLNCLKLITAKLSPESNVIKLINAAHIRYELVSSVNHNRRNKFSKNKWSKTRYGFNYNTEYHKYEDIANELIALNESAPNFARVVSVGFSTEGRSILTAILNDKSETSSKKKVVIECGVHAREWISTASCLWILNQLVRNRNSDFLAKKYEFVIIPVLNPDGYHYSWTVDRMWRKSRSKSNRSHCIGTDLNRNWNSKWCSVGASSDPCDDQYCGESPFSEPETKHLSSFLGRFANQIVAYFALHSFSQLWLYPVGYTRQSVPNNNQLLRLSKDATISMYKTHHHIYKFGSISQLTYPVSGSSVDWIYENLGVNDSFAIELRDTGRYGFLLPAKFITPTAEEVWEGIKTVLNEI